MLYEFENPHIKDFTVENDNGIKDMNLYHPKVHQIERTMY